MSRSFITYFICHCSPQMTNKRLSTSTIFQTMISTLPAIAATHRRPCTKWRKKKIQKHLPGGSLRRHFFDPTKQDSNSKDRIFGKLTKQTDCTYPTSRSILWMSFTYFQEGRFICAFYFKSSQRSQYL